MKKSVIAAVSLIVLLCCGFCCRAGCVKEIPLGDGLPIWEFDGSYTPAELPEDAAEQGLIGIYAADNGLSDVYVYDFPGDGGVSLEDFGQQSAAQRNVFCNMTTDRSVPVAMLNYHERIEDEHYIVQAYIYKDGKGFAEIRTMYKTEPVPLGSGGLTIHMIREYDTREQEDSPLFFDTVYSSANDRLPQVRILRFFKDDFPAGTVEPKLLETVSTERYAELDEGGWTLDEFITLYGEGFDLLKGEVARRNGLDHAFIGYVDAGIFYTRAYIDTGDDYLLICAEAEASRFQHLTNALIDAVEKNDRTDR